MCHGKYGFNGKTIRFKSENPKHKDAVPYRRTVKHKASTYEEYK